MPEPMLVVEGHNVSLSEYWDPIRSEDSMSVAYFRGRKLQGRTVALPNHCKGVVVERRSQEQGGKQSDHQEHGRESAGDVETEVLQVTAQFEQVLVWSHGASIDHATDPCVRGLDEWLQVAGKIHSFSERDEAGASRNEKKQGEV